MRLSLTRVYIRIPVADKIDVVRSFYPTAVKFSCHLWIRKPTTNISACMCVYSFFFFWMDVNGKGKTKGAHLLRVRIDRSDMAWCLKGMYCTHRHVCVYCIAYSRTHAADDGEEDRRASYLCIQARRMKAVVTN